MPESIRPPQFRACRATVTAMRARNSEPGLLIALLRECVYADIELVERHVQSDSYVLPDRGSVGGHVLLLLDAWRLGSCR